MPSPLPLQPVLNFSTLFGSEAGNRVTCAPKALVTQMRLCWSMPRWNGPTNDLHGSSLSPSQTILPLLKSPLGKWMSWLFVIPTTHTSLLGVTMTPCISPSLPSNVIPSGGVNGFPLLSNTEIDFPPQLVSQALSLASTAAPNVPPCIPPPAKPVVIGERGRPFGANLLALPCHSVSCPCHPIVKLSPTQRLPSLSNIAFPPARYPPPSNLSGSTHALGGKLRYGMNGT